jgi:uncharacterized protein (TIGR01244 family)
MRLRQPPEARRWETFRMQTSRTRAAVSGSSGLTWKGADMRIRTGSLIALAVVLLAAAIFAAEGAAAIDRFFRISDRVALGGQPTPEQVTALSDEGFNAIINLREDAEFNDGPQSHAARNAGMQFVRIPVSRENPSDAAVEKFLTATDDKALYPIYIYCAEGNRAEALWMIRRVVRDGWTVANAEAEATRAGLPEGKMLDFARDYAQRHAKGAPKDS